MKGKAAVLKGFRQPYEIQEFPVPEVAPGAILIKISMANICGRTFISGAAICRSDSAPKGQFSAMR